MHVAIHDHHGKSERLREALSVRGHKVTGSRQPGDVLLVDYDGPVGHYQQTIERHVSAGAKVFLYQHGAMPMTHYDGIHTPSDRVSGFFTFAEGHKVVMESYGYPHPIYVVGWYYSDLAPYRRQKHPRRILYAPWHPLSTGFIPPLGRRLNRQVMEALIDLADRRPEMMIRVRHLYTPELNELPLDPRIEYRQATPELDTLDIDWADVVISHGTFSRLAIARGVPTIMYGQDQVPYDGATPEQYREVANFERYAEYMRYPFDFDNGELWPLIMLACRNEPVEWKDKFIGNRFVGDSFCEILEREVGEFAYA